MLKYTRLILAVLLTGCATQAGEQAKPLEIVIPSTPDNHNTLLETIDATLEVADEAIDEIIEEKIESRNQIIFLQSTVNEEEDLIETLSEKLNVKDSLILYFEKNNETLKEMIQEVEGNLKHALHKCTNQCFPKIAELTQENKELLNHMDSLQTWVFYLDSLVSTNKKLSKKLNM